MKRLFVMAATLLGLVSAACADETRLIFTTISLPGSTISDQVWHPWADRVNTAGQGLVHIDVRDGLTLASSTNYFSPENFSSAR